ncbi:ZASP-like protein [Mya arenaria]|uniref:ZASP-like protein n=1 Tax=Mya arenaria TaxID=6604 RepID=A0ABY7DJ34_MYAAR|nr:protein SON-like [Mya arenaria]WAQ97657.1 ZASP-like protein [Mya arenaria]
MSQEDQVVSVRLRRSTTSTPWGFRMQGGHEYGAPLFIQTVNPKSLSARHGLRVGDRLLAICNTEAHRMSHEQAKMEIIRAGNELDLIVQRRPGQPQDIPDAGRIHRQQNKHEATEESTQYRGYTNPNVQSRSFKILQESLGYSEANEEGIILPTGGTPGESIVRRAYNEGKHRLEELSEINPRNFTNEGESPYRYSDAMIRDDDASRLRSSGAQPERRRRRRREKPDPADNVASEKQFVGVTGSHKVAPVDIAMSSVLSPAAGQQQYLEQAKSHYQREPEVMPQMPVVHQSQPQRPVSHQSQSNQRPLKLINYNFEEQYGHQQNKQKAVVSPQKSNDFIPSTKTVSSVAADLDLKHSGDVYGQGHASAGQPPVTSHLDVVSNEKKMGDPGNHMHVHEDQGKANPPVAGYKSSTATVMSPPTMVVVQNAPKAAPETPPIAIMKSQQMAVIEKSPMTEVENPPVTVIKSEQMAVVEKSPMTVAVNPPIAVVQVPNTAILEKVPPAAVDLTDGAQSSKPKGNETNNSVSAEENASSISEPTRETSPLEAIEESMSLEQKSSPKDAAVKALDSVSQKIDLHASGESITKVVGEEEITLTTEESVTKEEKCAPAEDVSVEDNAKTIEESMSKEEKIAPKDVAVKAVEEVSKRIVAQATEEAVAQVSKLAAEQIEVKADDDSKVSVETEPNNTKEISTSEVTSGGEVKATTDVISDTQAENESNAGSQLAMTEAPLETTIEATENKSESIQIEQSDDVNAAIGETESVVNISVDEEIAAPMQETTDETHTFSIDFNSDADIELQNEEVSFSISTDADVSSDMQESVNISSTENGDANTEAAISINFDTDVTDAGVETVEIEATEENAPEKNAKDEKSSPNKLPEQKTPESKTSKPERAKFVDSQGGVAARLAKFKK